MLKFPDNIIVPICIVCHTPCPDGYCPKCEPKGTKIVKHQKICEKLNSLYAVKNAAYGDAFGKTFELLGVISALTRMYDKINRLISLSKGAKENNESFKDSLMDLANYAIMTLIELEKNDS